MKLALTACMALLMFSVQFGFAQETSTTPSVELPILHKVLSAGMSPTEATKAMPDITFKLGTVVGNILELKTVIGDTTVAGGSYKLLLSFYADKLTSLSLSELRNPTLAPWLQSYVDKLPAAETTFKADSSDDEDFEGGSKRWDSPKMNCIFSWDSSYSPTEYHYSIGFPAVN
jgi:hypothetical protein